MSVATKKGRIVIAGAGPAGFLAAMASAKKGREVVLFENRDYFPRGQRISLKEKSIKILEQIMININIHFQKLGKQGIKIDKKHLKFVEKVKQDLDKGTQNLKSFQIKDLQNLFEVYIQFLYPNITYKKGSRFKITAINGKEQTVQYQETLKDNKVKNETLDFSHFVAADGGKREMMKMLALDKDYSHKIENLPMQTRQLAHGTVTLEIRHRTPKQIADQALERIRQGKTLSLSYEEHIEALEEAGWNQPWLPDYYFLPSNQGKKWFLAGEIPDKILKEQDKKLQFEMLEKWGQTILFLTQGVPMDWAEIRLKSQEVQPSSQMQDDMALSQKLDYLRAKERLKATAFPVELDFVVDPCISLGKKGVFVALGEASKKANFHIAHGVGDAMEDGLSFAEALNDSDDSFNMDLFRKKRKESLERMTKEMEKRELAKQEDYRTYEVMLAKRMRHLEQNLGRISDTIQFQIESLRKSWKEHQKILLPILPKTPSDLGVYFKQQFEEAFQAASIDKIYLLSVDLAKECLAANKGKFPSLFPGFFLNAVEQAVNKSQVFQLEAKKTQESISGFKKAITKQQEKLNELKMKKEKLQEKNNKTEMPETPGTPKPKREK